MSDSVIGVLEGAFTATQIHQESDRMPRVPTVSLFGARL